MILPMMGLLFMLFITGLALGAVLAFVPTWRSRAPLAIIPILASLGSCAGAWGGAIGLESLISSPAGGAGFFGGYVLGGILGAGAGWRIARARGAIRRRGGAELGAPAA